STYEFRGGGWRPYRGGDLRSARGTEKPRTAQGLPGPGPSENADQPGGRHLGITRGHVRQRQCQSRQVLKGNGSEPVAERPRIKLRRKNGHPAYGEKIRILQRHLDRRGKGKDH